MGTVMRGTTELPHRMTWHYAKGQTFAKTCRLPNRFNRPARLGESGRRYQS
jgi:hypothetical protein